MIKLCEQISLKGDPKSDSHVTKFKLVSSWQICMQDIAYLPLFATAANCFSANCFYAYLDVPVSVTYV